MQIANQQPCLEQARTMHPVMVRKGPLWTQVSSQCSQGAHICLLAGTCCKAAEDRTWLPASLCRQKHSAQPQWTNLSDRPRSAWLTETLVPYQAKEKQFGQQGCKAKARPFQTQSMTKINYCSQLNAFKKQKVLS